MSLMTFPTLTKSRRSCALCWLSDGEPREQREQMGTGPVLEGVERGWARCWGQHHGTGTGWALATGIEIHSYQSQCYTLGSHGPWVLIRCTKGLGVTSSTSKKQGKAHRENPAHCAQAEPREQGQKAPQFSAMDRELP